MFENASFKMEIEGPRYKNMGLDMCFTPRSLVSRLVRLPLVETVLFSTPIGNGGLKY